MDEPQITEELLQTLYPLAADVIVVFDQSGANPSFALNDAQLKDLWEALTALFDSQELRDAVRSLLGVAHSFEKQNIARAAQQMFELLRQKPLLDALDRVNAAKEAATRDAVADSSRKFKDFQDTTASKSAPQVGDERPDGTLSLDKLKFPKRL